MLRNFCLCKFFEIIKKKYYFFLFLKNFDFLCSVFILLPISIIFLSVILHIDLNKRTVGTFDFPFHFCNICIYITIYITIYIYI